MTVPTALALLPTASLAEVHGPDHVAADQPRQHGAEERADQRNAENPGIGDVDLRGFQQQVQTQGQQQLPQEHADRRQHDQADNTRGNLDPQEGLAVSRWLLTSQ